MNQGYLERESKRVNEAARKRGTRLLIVGACLIALIYFLMRDSLDLKDPSNQTVVYCMIGLVGLLLLGVVAQLLRSRPAVNGKNLILPFEEGTKEAVGKLIDRRHPREKSRWRNISISLPRGKRHMMKRSYYCLRIFCCAAIDGNIRSRQSPVTRSIGYVPRMGIKEEILSYGC